MRLYKVTATGEPETCADAALMKPKWLGTNADCVAHRKVIKDAGFRQKDIETVEVDVPTDKQGLLAFLNKMSAA